MGPYAIAGQYQQQPSTRGGEILQRDWWQTWGDPENGVGSKFPAFSLTVGILDSAHTTKDSNDPSGFMVLGVFAHQETGYPQVMLARAWCKRLPIHELVVEVDLSCRKYRVDTLIIENKANGIDVENELQRMFGRHDYGVTFTRFARAGRQGNDKVARAFSIAPLMANGLVWRPITDWSDAVVDQCCMFPRAAHDEYVDCLSHGLRWLRDQGILEMSVEIRDREAMLSRPIPRSASRPVYRT
jgi:predicted phage terminase large subunit-like protein